MGIVGFSRMENSNFMFSNQWLDRKWLKMAVSNMAARFSVGCWKCDFWSYQSTENGCSGVFKDAEFKFDVFKSIMWMEMAQNSYFQYGRSFSGGIVIMHTHWSYWSSENWYIKVFKDAEFKFDVFKTVTWPELSQNSELYWNYTALSTVIVSSNSIMKQVRIQFEEK